MGRGRLRPRIAHCCCSGRREGGVFLLRRRLCRQSKVIISGICCIPLGHHISSPYGEGDRGGREKSVPMVNLSTWCRYVVHKVAYSISYSVKNHRRGQISENELLDTVWKNLFQGKLTYLHWNKGQEMAPTIAGEGGVLVRRLPDANPMTVFVGDVVVLKDPEKPEDYLVRRLTAIEGYEMVSTNNNEEPFILEKDQCWVVSDNETFKPKEARDSRTLGPLNLGSIVGRVLYSLRTAVDHGPVKNSYVGMQQDYPVLAVELDVSEMLKNPKP